MMCACIRMVVYSLCALFAAQSVTHAQEWRRGAVAVVNSAPDVRVVELGGVAVDITSLPVYSDGLITADAETGDRLMLLASNGVLIDFLGRGHFSVERFEQQVSAVDELLDGAAESGTSRMILNVRSGAMVLDQRKLSDASQLILETPVGRVFGRGRVVWMIEVDRDLRKGTYTFNIFCRQGQVRFSDLAGHSYTIRSGQRISGAGSSQKPSIEVAELTADAEEYLEGFQRRVELVAGMTLSEDMFMRALGDLAISRTDGASDIAVSVKQSSLRPIVIDYVPRRKPVTAYQGVAKPPSAAEAELF